MLNKNEESAWQKASASLDVSAKVYGYRVDSVHSEAFKFLGGLNRNKKDDEQEKEEELGEEKEKEEIKKENKIRRGQNTLETNLNKLNLTKYDLETEVDPLFSIMTSKFNESSASGVLLNTIPLDENLNYILESKEKNNDEQNLNNNKNEKKKEENENKEKEILSIDSSNDNLGNKKLSEKLKDDEDNISNKRKNPITCSESMDLIPEDIKKVLKDFTSENQIDNFIQLKICPDLSVFRETRELNSKENNEIFLKYFQDEINHAERIKGNKFLEQDEIQEEPEDIENHYDDGHMENAPDDLSQNENGMDPNDIKDMEEPSQENANLSNYNLENVSLSLFKYDDLIEHSGKFGSGNIDVLRSLPHFNNFSKAFGKIDNKGYLNKNAILGLNKKEGVKKKKEEILFEFKEENEVDINKLLTESKSKKIPKAYDFTYDYENKRKLKCFYHFDKLSCFRLYTMNNRTIFLREIEDINEGDQQQKILNKIEEEDGVDAGDFGENNDLKGFEGENSMVNDFPGKNNTFFQNEKEIEKNFGRLYRRFDIRTLKNKIWNNYESFFPRDNIDFKNIVRNMSKDMNEEEIYSISTPTCFVCMLHLCNENNLYINQKDINTFFIEKDSNGEKSAQTSKTKNNDITKPKNRKSKKNKNKDDEMSIDE